MNFEQNFSTRLIKDLEEGRYVNATDFAAGITRHYMGSLDLNAPSTLGPLVPAFIPPTLPAPAQLGAPAPVGPTVSINRKTREKLFYNTVRTYFVAKEISQGKLNVRMLSRDVRSAISEYKRVTTQVKQYYNEIQQLDDRLEALRKDLQNIIPELKKFIQSKKDILKEAKTEFSSIGDKLRALKQQGLSDFDFDVIMAEELKDLDFFLNFKIEPSLNLENLRETFNTVRGLLDRSITTGKKYKNIFSKEANFKVYISKKIEAATKEILKLLDGFLNWEKYVTFWKDLTYVPGGQRISKIMLNIINQNSVLKEAKKRLLAKVEGLKRSVMSHLQKKIDDLLDRLKKAGDWLVDRLKIKSTLNKFNKKLKASKLIQNTVKRIKAIVKYSVNIIRHAMLVLKEVTKIVVKLVNLFTSIQSAIAVSKRTVAKIKEKYSDFATSIDESKSPQYRLAKQQALEELKQSLNFRGVGNEDPTKKFIATVGANSPLLSQIMNAIDSALGLNEQQLAAFLRVRSKKVQVQINSIDSILTKDIPRLQILIAANPNSSNYKATIKRADAIAKSPTGVTGVASVYSKGQSQHKTYLFLVKQVRLAGVKLQELQDRLTLKVKQETKNIADTQKQKDAVLDYVDTILETKPKLKKVKNKKRRVELDIAETKAKVAKLKKLAKEARMAYSIVTNGYRIFVGLPQNKETPISSNERSMRSLVINYCDFQIERGKMKPKEKTAVIKRFNIKIADLKAYEVIYRFFNEVIRESQSSKFTDKIKEELGKKADSLEAKSTQGLKALTDILSGAYKSPDLITLSKLPDQIFGQIDIATALYRAEKKSLAKLRAKVSSLSSFIPAKTQDPGLKFIRRQLNTASSFVLLILNAIRNFFKKIVEFIETLMKPVTDFLKRTLTAEAEKIKDRETERVNALLVRKTNLEGRAMSFMFGLAARLFWTGATWSNPVGTRFVVLNIGRFSPTMKATSENGSQGYGEELAKAFNTQLKKMRGMIVPLPSTGIVPFGFKGYLPKQVPPPIPPSDFTNASIGSVRSFF